MKCDYLPAPSIVSPPANGSTVNNPVLDWSYVYEDGHPVDSFRIQISSANYLKILTPSVSIYDTSLLGLVDGNYFWSVAAIDSHGVEGDYSTGQWTEIGSDPSYSLSLVFSPEDPIAGQDVVVKACLLPPRTNVSIDFTVSGTDGYNPPVETKLTGSDGCATIIVWGDVEPGTKDTVTAQALSLGLTTVITYTF